SPPGELFHCGVGGAFAGVPGAGYRAPLRLVHGFAGEPQAAAQGLRQRPARRLTARRRRRNAPSTQGSLLQRVACVRAAARFTLEPSRPASQSIANAVIAASPSSARSAANLPATSTTQSGDPERFASTAALRASAPFWNTNSSLCSPSGFPESSI